MARFNDGKTPNDSADPAAQEFEAQLDLLVDDELAEEPRRQVIESLDKGSTQWKTLATRFLERQAEKKAVKQLIAGVALSSQREIPPTYSFPRLRHTSSWGGLRNVAAIAIVAALAAYGGSHWGRTAPSVGGVHSDNSEANASMMAPLPGNILGDEHAADFNVKVPLLAKGQVPQNYPFAQSAPQDGNGVRHVVITPWGKDRAVVFPVTTPNVAEFR